MSYWIVDSVVQKDSRKIPHTVCWHITLENLHTAQRKQTWVESTFKNSTHWREIIELYPLGMIVSVADSEHTYINADSKPEIVQTADRPTLASEVKRFRDSR